MEEERVCCKVQGGQDLAPEGCLGSAAVEANRNYPGVVGEKMDEVVDRNRFRFDIAVEAGLPPTVADNVPQGDAVVFQQLQLLGVGQVRGGAENFAYDPPESIAGMGIILLLPE